MLISRRQGIRRIAEILTASGLFIPEEIRMVQDYFEGDSDEALKLGHRDLDGVRKELLAEQLWFVRNEMFPMAVRAGNLYFALGVVDADNCLPDVCWEKKPKAPAPVKMATDFAYSMGMEYAERIREPFLRMLMNIARNDPEIIRKAYEGQKDTEEDADEDTPDGIILLTVYFLLKYPQVNPQNRVDDFAELLKQQKCSKKEAERELALMQQYEELLIQNFRKIYDKQPSKQALDEIERALREGRVDDRIRKLALADTSDQRRTVYLNDCWKHAIGLAFVNFSLSPRLKDVVSLCIAANADEMLFAMNHIDMRGDFRDRGGNFDEIFGIDTETLITCAAVLYKDNILKEQFGRNREFYLDCMDKMRFEYYLFMSEVIGQVDAAFHKGREQLELARQQEDLMSVYTADMDTQKRKEMKKYLSGKTGVEALYSLAEKIIPHGDWGKWHWEVMGCYRKAYGYDTLCKRCEAALMVCGRFDLYCLDYLFDCDYLYEEVKVDKERMKELFRGMEEEGVTLRSQLDGFLQIRDAVQYEKKVLKAFTDVGKEIFGAYLEKQPEGMLEAFRGAEISGRIFGLQVLAGKKKLSGDIVSGFARDQSKEVREALVDVLCKSKSYEKDVRKMLDSSKMVEREVAVKVLVRWAGKQSGEKYVPVLKETLEKEASAKIRTLIAGMIPVDGQEQAEESRQAPPPDINIIKELHKGNKKRFLAWAYEAPFPKVHKKTGEEADEEYLQAILLAYAAMSLKDVMVSEEDMEAGKRGPEDGGPYYVNSVAAALVQSLNAEEFAVYAGELLERWIAAGSDTKKRWVLYAAALHGNAHTTDRICSQVPEWAEDSKTIAVEALQALVFGLQPRALLFVDGIARKKIKVKRVRGAAEKVLKAVAARLGTTWEGLLDRAVPDFGFDDKRRRWFDYGKRRFFVTISAAFETELFDETGKMLKKLPAPGKQEDEGKAAAAYEEFKLLKKQIKEEASLQKIRLETALSHGREWSAEAWENLFVRNPVMYPFAIGLIWGLYEDGELVSGFRYREDGSFRTEDAREIHPMGEKASRKIKILHPLELTKESLEAWRQQLEEDGILQPVLQIDRPVFRLKEEEAEQKKLDRFDGCVMDYAVLVKRLIKLGWNNTNFEDGYYVYSKENDELSMRVELAFQFNYYKENATIYDAKFYHIKGDEIPEEEDACLLQCVPERYFSEIVMQLDSVMEDI